MKTDINGRELKKRDFVHIKNQGLHLIGQVRRIEKNWIWIKYPRRRSLLPIECRQAQCVDLEFWDIDAVVKSTNKLIACTS